MFKLQFKYLSFFFGLISILSFFNIIYSYYLNLYLNLDTYYYSLIISFIFSIIFYKIKQIEIKYLMPIMIGDEIIIKSYFITNQGPRIKVNSTLTNLMNKIHAEASIDIVLINKETFKVVRKRPSFIENYLCKLSKAP